MIYVALLRAVNVGGTGALAMKDLVTLCARAGFDDPRTYIQSGNVVFGASAKEPKVKASLEAALAKKMKKPVGVLVRSADELAAVVKANPFAKAPPNKVIVFFYDEPPANVPASGPNGEELRLVGRELFVHYPNGQGTSKLKVPNKDATTGRNLNTVTKLLAMCG